MRYYYRVMKTTNNALAKMLPQNSMLMMSACPLT